MQLRTFLILALATCALAGYLGYPGYRSSYSYRAPTYSTVAHVPAYGYGYGHGLGYGYGVHGLGYGLNYGYGLGALGYGYGHGLGYGNSTYGLGYGLNYGHGLGALRYFRTFLILALATCALAGYFGYPARTSYSYRATPFTGYGAVSHVPAFGYGYGHGLVHGYRTYGLGY
ncbi:unnamed protein product, partial [Ixodes hexagonus]